MAAPRNEEEITALEKFRASTKYEELSDGVLMRYLRARDLDLVKAEEAIKSSLEWKLNHIDDKLSPPLPEFESTFKIHFMGNDPEGRVVIYIRFGEWLPLRDLFERHDPSAVLLFAYQLLSSLHRKVQKSKHQQLICIWDNFDIGFTKIFHEVQNWAEVQLLRDVIQMMDLNFPETLYKAFFINTARGVVWGFNLVKPFMKPYTLAKILIHGSDPGTWLPEIKEYLDDGLIPENLGGSGTLDRSLHDFVKE